MSSGTPRQDTQSTSEGPPVPVARATLGFALGGLALALGALALGLQACSPGLAQVVQPMTFSHATHHEEELACVDCHIRSEEGPYATIPKVKACLLCHEEAQGEHPDEGLIREYAERDEPIPWVQVNHVVGHVYFSHAPHVVTGEMECAECHGDMTTVDEPVTESQVDWLTMEACMDCHFERQVSNDCLLCHK